MHNSQKYFDQLINTPKNKRKNALLRMPAFVVDDIVEILFNIGAGNVKVPTSKIKKIPQPFRRTVSRLNKYAFDKKKRRQYVYKQSGGFLGAILPLIAGIIAANV